MRHVGSGQHATVALQPCPALSHQVSAAVHTPHSPAGASNVSTSGDAVSPLLDSSSMPGIATHQQAACLQSASSTGQQPGRISSILGFHHSTASDMPYQQQQDRFLLDHRIHWQTAAATAGAAAEPAGSTAAVPQLATVLHNSSAPINILRHSSSSVSASSDVENTQVADARYVQAEQTHKAVPGCLGQDSRAVTGTLGLPGTSPSIFTSSELPNARKGVVLLDLSTPTCTSWEFEAVMVLLNGHWPARGLLSGRWPPHPSPQPQTPDTVLSDSLPEFPSGKQTFSAGP